MNTESEGARIGRMIVASHNAERARVFAEGVAEGKRLSESRVADLEAMKAALLHACSNAEAFQAEFTPDVQPSLSTFSVRALVGDETTRTEATP